MLVLSKLNYLRHIVGLSKAEEAEDQDEEVSLDKLKEEVASSEEADNDSTNN